MRTIRFLIGFPFLLVGCLLAGLGALVMCEEHVHAFIDEVFKPQA